MVADEQLGDEDPAYIVNIPRSEIKASWFLDDSMDSVAVVHTQYYLQYQKEYSRIRCLRDGSFNTQLLDTQIQ